MKNFYVPSLIAFATLSSTFTWAMEDQGKPENLGTPLYSIIHKRDSLSDKELFRQDFHYEITRKPKSSQTWHDLHEKVTQDHRYIRANVDKEGTDLEIVEDYSVISFSAGLYK